MVSTTGCRIAKARKIISFLGCPIGVQISIDKETKYLMDKVRKRVSHWANKLLTLQGRVVLVKDVLQAIPIYHLMVLTLKDVLKDWNRFVENSFGMWRKWKSKGAFHFLVYHCTTHFRWRPWGSLFSAACPTSQAPLCNSLVSF